MYLVGFRDTAFNVATHENEPTSGVYFVASSTAGNSNTWKAVVRNNNTSIIAETGVATSSSAFQKMRVELSSSTATFLINGSVVASISPASMPSVNLTASIAEGVFGTFSSTNIMDIALIRLWVDDPPGSMVISDGETESVFSHVEGASLSTNYLTNASASFIEGQLLSQSSSTEFVQHAEGAYDSRLLGVMAQNSFSILGQGTANTVRIGMVGRVPAIVSLENGPIHKGDKITSASSTIGVGMKAKRAGYVVGSALESFDETMCDAEVKTELEAAGVVVPSTACVARILVALNPGFDMGIGNMIRDITAPITDMAGAMAELASTVYEEGSEFTKMVVGQITAKVALIEKLFAKETHTQKLCVADESGAETCITKAQLDALISGAAGAQSGGGSGGSGSGSGEGGGGETPGDTTAPVLNFNGAAASSTIAIGSTYVDPVTATDETAPTNPDVYASVNGATPILLSSLTLDTSTSTVYTIDYSATDAAGNIGTAQRTVEVGTQ